MYSKILMFEGSILQFLHLFLLSKFIKIKEANFRIFLNPLKLSPFATIEAGFPNALHFDSTD